MNQTLQPSPVETYAEATQLVNALQALDTAEVNPLSYTSFLTHGHKTERAILLLHGYTNSPREYVQLAQEFYQRGYNVLVPRFPRHGLRDRMTSALEKQTESELLAFTSAAIDILPGLGSHVTVAGISMGGILALWAAQHRADVSLACAISPALAFRAIPLALTRLVIQSYLRLPNQFRWWDETQKDKEAPPLHAYPRFSTRGLAHITNIGLKIRALARHSKPVAGSALMITNPTDESLDNTYAHEIVQRWQRLGATNIRQYAFDPQLKLKHDVMDPDQPYQQVNIVYPILLDLITGRDKS